MITRKSDTEVNLSKGQKHPLEMYCSLRSQGAKKMNTNLLWLEFIEPLCTLLISLIKYVKSNFLYFAKILNK